MKYVIDRFEGDVAICEDDSRNFIEIRRDRLPAGAKEGSVLSVCGGGAISLSEDPERSKRIAGKMDSVWR